MNGRLAGASGPIPTSPRPAGNGGDWIVAEDTNEYLPPAGRRVAGASLGRLLNLTDGLLGQDHHVLVLLTTNEGFTRLDPALVRSGPLPRQSRVPALRRAAEAQVWLPPDGRHGWATLAEFSGAAEATLSVVGIEQETPAQMGTYL